MKEFRKPVELKDDSGKIHGPFRNARELWQCAESLAETQRDDDDGRGFEISVKDCE